MANAVGGGAVVNLLKKLILQLLQAAGPAVLEQLLVWLTGLLSNQEHVATLKAECAAAFAKKKK